MFHANHLWTSCTNVEDSLLRVARGIGDHISFQQIQALAQMDIQRLLFCHFWWFHPLFLWGSCNHDLSLKIKTIMIFEVNALKKKKTINWMKHRSHTFISQSVLCSKNLRVGLFKIARIVFVASTRYVVFLSCLTYFSLFSSLSQNLDGSISPPLIFFLLSSFPTSFLFTPPLKLSFL